MLFKFKILLLFVIWSVASNANFNEKPIVIKGKVLSNSIALEGVSISINTLQKNTFTDAAGNFTFLIPSYGKYILHFTAIGFSDVVKEFDFSSEENLKLIIELERINNQLEDVVVSGSLHLAHRNSSPIPIEVYSEKYFKKNPTANLFEGLSFINGVQTQLNCNVCNTGEIRINGMEGPYTSVLLDGMPIVSSLATVYGLSGIPVNLIKRVEIIKGPASTLFGSEAVGGLINIITKDPYNSEKLSIDASVTSLKEFNLDAGSSFNIGKTNALLGLNLFWFNSKFDINNDKFTDVTLQQRVSLFNKWNFYRKSNNPFQLALRLFTENRNGGELNWNKNYRGSDVFYGESIYTNRVELISNYGFNVGKEKFKIDVSYNYHHQNSFYGTTKYIANQHTYFSQIRWNKNLKKHFIMAGVPFKFIHYDDNTPVTAKLDGTTQADILKTASIFLQDEWNASEKIKILTGVRYENNNRHKGIITPRFSLKYALNNQHAFRASSGNGFRIVNIFTEDHAALSGFREVVIKNELKPEKSWNINLNYTGTYYLNSGIINIDASVFYTKFSNKIIPDYFTDPTKIIYDNLQTTAISKGISLNTDLILDNGIKLNTGISLMKVYTNELDRLGNKNKIDQLYAPQFTCTYGMSYLWKRANINFDITGKFLGTQKMPTVPNDFRDEYAPSFNLTNLQITKKLIHNKEIYCSFKNLFNYIPNNIILHADDPFNKAGGKYFDASGNPRLDTNPNNYTFDPTYNYAPMQGIKVHVGFRFHFD